MVFVIQNLSCSFKVKHSGAGHWLNNYVQEAFNIIILCPAIWFDRVINEFLVHEGDDGTLAVEYSDLDFEDGIGSTTLKVTLFMQIALKMFNLLVLYHLIASIPNRTYPTR